MAVIFLSENIPFPGIIKKRETENWIRAVADTYGKKVGDLSYLFCNDRKILEMNQQFLNHNYFTDIITFDYSEKDVISGDIVISLDTVRSNAEKYNTRFKEELQRVVIHGVLHLCGLNDKTEEEQQLMREAENKALDLLNNKP